MSDKNQAALMVIIQGMERMAAALRLLIDPAEPPATLPPITTPMEPSPPCRDLQILGIVPGVSDQVVTSAVLGDAVMAKAIEPTEAPPNVVPTQLVNAYGGGTWEITPDGGVALNGTTLFHAARLGGRAVELALGRGQNWVRTEAGKWFAIAPDSIYEDPNGPAGPKE